MVSGSQPILPLCVCHHTALARRTIPRPSELLARLTRVYDLGKEMKMADGRPLYKTGKGGMQATHKSIVREVTRGHVSDSPSIELYRVQKRNEHGWNVYSVARGSSAVEGFHFHVTAFMLCFSHCLHTFLVTSSVSPPPTPHPTPHPTSACTYTCVCTAQIDVAGFPRWS